jgi:hypothetical protein
VPIRRFRRRIPVQVSDCSPPPSNSCKTVPIRRFRRRIPVQVSAYSPLPSSNSCPSQCQFAASVVEFLSKSVPIRRFRRRIPARQCLFAASAVEFLSKSVPIRRFCRRIPARQCLFAASVVEFLSKSVPIHRFRRRISCRKSEPICRLQRRTPASSSQRSPETRSSLHEVPKTDRLPAPSTLILTDQVARRANF